MATAGQVLTWRGELAEVFYSASCGGRSERASDVWPGANYPYLVSREDDVCDHDPEWTVDFRLDEVTRVLQGIGFEGDRLKEVRVDGRTSSGRVARLRLSGMHPDVIAAISFVLRLEQPDCEVRRSRSSGMANVCASRAADSAMVSVCA